MGVNVDGTKCIMCDVGDMVKARTGATFCPKIFKSAIHIVRNTTSAPTSTSSTPISTSTSTSKPTSTSTSSSTSKPTSTSTSTCSHAYITPMNAHDIHDLTFEYEDDFPLPVAKSPVKTYADASHKLNIVWNIRYVTTSFNNTSHPIRSRHITYTSHYITYTSGHITSHHITEYHPHIYIKLRCVCTCMNV